MDEPPADPDRCAGCGNILTEFASRVSGGPRWLAVADGENRWSYRELDRAANGIALAIADQSGPGIEAVGLLAAHGAGQLAARLGILKAGKTVLVLDTQDSPERVRQLLLHAEARLLLADGANGEGAEMLEMPHLAAMRFDRREGADSPPLLPEEIAPGSPSEVLYTSGSTGEPKGVVQTHQNVLAKIRNYTAAAHLRVGDRLTLLTRGHFAAASSAIYGALLNGASLFPFDTREHGFREMKDWLIRERITVYHSVPTLFRRFCESLGNDEIFPDVRVIKLGGEPLMNYDIRLLNRHFTPRCEILNGLGMTEANGNICYFHIPHGHAADFEVVPVGSPSRGFEIAIVNEVGDALPRGEVGEIAFRGVHRSPGYWKSGGFERNLIPAPDQNGGAPFFRTRDLGKIDEEGRLLHLGRKDRLLKIRGVRVEPVSIEAALSEHATVSRCVVRAWGEGSKAKRLAAYVVPAQGQPLDVAALRDHLKAKLPPSHLPAWFLSLRQLPQTAGGKVDYRALPDPAGVAEGARRSGVAQDGLQLELEKIWCRILRIRYAGSDADFFELGGDSLLAALMLSRVETKMKVVIGHLDFVRNPTISSLAQLVRSRGGHPSFARAVPVFDGGDGIPFFYIPAAGVDASNAAHLPWSATIGRPVYGIQYPGFDGVEAPMGSIGELAEYFVREVKRIQGEGPYSFGGGSFGGLVAFEAARRLHEGGERIETLVLLDTRLRGHSRPRRSVGFRGRLERALLRLLPVGEQDEITAAALRGAMRQARYRVLLPLVRRQCARRGKPLPKVYRFYNLLNSAVAAKRSYNAPDYEGPITLLRFEQQAQERLFEVDRTLGWGERCPKLEIRDLPGAHGALSKNAAGWKKFARDMEELLSRGRE